HEYHGHGDNWIFYNTHCEGSALRSDRGSGQLAVWAHARHTQCWDGTNTLSYDPRADNIAGGGRRPQARSKPPVDSAAHLPQRPCLGHIFRLNAGRMAAFAFEENDTCGAVFGWWRLRPWSWRPCRRAAKICPF